MNRLLRKRSTLQQLVSIHYVFPTYRFIFVMIGRRGRLFDEISIGALPLKFSYFCTMLYLSSTYYHSHTKLKTVSYKNIVQ